MPQESVAHSQGGRLHLAQEERIAFAFLKTIFSVKNTNAFGKTLIHVNTMFDLEQCERVLSL